MAPPEPEIARELPSAASSAARNAIVPFETLREGDQGGPFRYRLTRALSEGLRGTVGSSRPVRAVPPAVYLVCLLQAYADTFGGIPAGGVLVAEELELGLPAAPDAEVEVTTRIAGTSTGPKRPRVVVAFEVRSPKGEPHASGSMTVAWAPEAEQRRACG